MTDRLVRSLGALVAAWAGIAPMTQAQDLARWLEQMHGSRRTVIASRTAPGDIELRLPLRLTLPDAPRAPSC